MNATRAVALLEDLVAIPSPTGAEAAAAALAVERMRDLGFRAYVDDAGNAIGELGDRGPEILLLGHIDTVAADVPPRRVGDLLFGRGTVDAKGPFACAVCAAHAAHLLAPQSARLVVVGAVEEEGSSRGALSLLDRYSPDALVIAEPSGASSVVVGYKGRFWFRYDVRCAPAHTSTDSARAAELASEFWVALKDALAKQRDGAATFDRVDAALTTIEGTIETARAHVSCRVPPGFEAATLVQTISGLLGDGEITVLEHTPGVRTDQRDPVVRSLRAAIRRRGEAPRVKVKTGTSDMNVVAPRWRVPMAAYGPGDSSLDHTSDEHIDLREFVSAIDVLADALVDLAADLRAAPAPATDNGLTPEEEALLTDRLHALGYIE